MAPRRVEFNLVLDQWPAGLQEMALQSLVDSGEVTAGRAGASPRRPPVPPRGRSLIRWRPLRSRLLTALYGLVTSAALAVLIP